MKVSLSGLLGNVTAALPARQRKYYGFCLEELHDHIAGLVNGEHTLEEFAEHYCIDRAKSQSQQEG